jgi:hypothetical protein
MLFYAMLDDAFAVVAVAVAVVVAVQPSYKQ